MPVIAEDVKKACSILQEVNPEAVNIFEEHTDQQLGIMFRNCIVTIYAPNADGSCEKIFTDMQSMEQWRKHFFLSQSREMEGVYMQELELEITRFGFK